MEHIDIVTDRQLVEFCEDPENQTAIGFDTEFVSEDTYENELCLIQIATEKQLAVVDPNEVKDLSVFWDWISQHEQPVICHAGREEYRFCLRHSKKLIANWFDVQMAAGMIGLEYPAAYGTLTQKLLGKKTPKGETRTDWRIRPLSPHQIEYALLDVVHLLEMHKLLSKRLEKMGRTDWFRQELKDWQQRLIDLENGENWRKLSGISALSARGLAIARELWRWRESVAKDKNKPARRILRDDLIVELSKREKADVRRIRAVRGMERNYLKSMLDEISEAISKALEIPKSDCPKPFRKKAAPPINLLSQFLNTALSAVCREAQIAPNIVGTTQDIRDWIVFRMNNSNSNSKTSDEAPALSQGWRSEIIGKKLDKLLQGIAGIFVTDPKAELPLKFVPIKP